jgi:hypothetical protein
VSSRAEDLLAGPRGRRLCLQLVLDAVERHWPPLSWTEGSAGYPVGRVDLEQARQSLALAVSEVDVAAMAATADPAAFLPALMASVDEARYWQEPDEVDLLLAEPALGAELRAIAHAVVEAPASRWWREPVAAADQHAVTWPQDDPPVFGPPAVVGAESALRSWREQTAADERRAHQERPADPRANWSGEWWSTPALTGGPVTTRALPIAGSGDQAAPVRLSLVEDAMGWVTARSWPVLLAGDARVLEVTGPADWVALVEQYPLEVTASRRHDWWRVTGRNGCWVIPDWAAVAADIDGVHLTVDGYLSAAGRALPVDVPTLGGQAATVLGGWDPDATWWLADVVTELGTAVDWRRDDHTERWTTADA